MKHILIYYSKIWYLYTKNAFTVWLGRRHLMAIFLLGKIIRYIFYFGFLYFLIINTGGILDYNQNQILFFTTTFITIDTISQFFFRNVYTFRQLIVSGDFDLVLLKPVNALFRSLMGGADLLDLITIPPIVLVTIYLGMQLNPTLLQVLIYIILVINGLVIAAALHIVVLSLGVVTLEVDHTIQVYRDLSSMARFPVDIYKEPLKSLLTFIIPVGIMMTLPAKGLMGLVSPITIILTVGFGVGLLFVSVRFWQFALKKYTSASS